MTPSSEATPRPWNILTIASSAGASSRIFSEVTNSDICHIPMEWNGRTNGADAAMILAAVNSYDESRKLLREAAEKLDALTLMLRSMKEARNGTALDMDGDELFGFVLPHESYMNAHMILNDAAWFARITAHLEAMK